MDPLERRKFRVLLRGTYPAPIVYVVVAAIYLGMVEREPLFGTRLAIAIALAAGLAGPVWAIITYRLAVARGRADARLAQTLLALAHGPGLAGFILAVGTVQLWYTILFGVEAFVGLLVLRGKLG